MTKARGLWPRRRGDTRSAPTPPALAQEDTPPSTRGHVTPSTVEECLYACTVFRAAFDAGDDRRRVRFAESLEALATAASHGGAQDAGATRGAQDAARGRSAKGAKGAKDAKGADGIDDALFDALLAVVAKGADCAGPGELGLALLVCDTALTERPGSRAGWRLRGRVTDALGDEAAAVEAYERYLAITANDAFNVAPRLTGLRLAQEAQRDTLRLLAERCPEAEKFGRQPAGANWAEGLALHDKGAYDMSEPRLVGALLAMGRACGEGFPVSGLQQAVGEYLDLRIDAAGGDAGELADLAGLYAEQRRNRMRPPLVDPLIGGVEWLSIGEFRNLLSGRSICLVANSERIAHSSLGPAIDAYDLVVRFSSYALDEAHTGARTDIHATDHESGFNWDQQVTTRLVFGGESERWRYRVRERLVPGAQRYVTDESLRWPLRNVGGVRWDRWPSVPTSGFNTIWLLDFLDVSPVIDLIGFDFYESGVHRLPGAMNVPLTSEREYTSEKAWVMEHAQSVTDTRISLR